MSNPTATKALTGLQAGTRASALASSSSQTQGVATSLQTPSSSTDADASQGTETILLKAKRSFTAAPLQRDVRVVEKGEEFEATPDFADFAITKKWVTKLDAD